MDSFTLTVNYDQSIRDACRAGGYDWGVFSLGKFVKTARYTRSGIHEVTVHLIHFNRLLWGHEAWEALDQMAMRPADIFELLALGTAQPDLQRRFSIIALGSLWHSLDGSWCNPYLAHLCRQIRLPLPPPEPLNLMGSGHYWGVDTRFAAIPKEKRSGSELPILPDQ